MGVDMDAPSLLEARRQRYRDIKAEMIRRGITTAQVARELGIHPASVTKVIQGIYKSKRVTDALLHHGIPGGLLENIPGSEYKGLLYGAGAENKPSDGEPKGEQKEAVS